MLDFKIYPVIDVLNAKVVHAIGGKRKNYKPLNSPLFESNDPLSVIHNLKDNFKIKYFYLADLDAIMKDEPNLEIYKEISNLRDTKIILDPGIKTINDIKIYSKFEIHSLILGLETIKNLNVIKKSLKICNEDEIIISIDMYKEKLITKIKEFKKLTPVKVITKLKDNGVKKIILLDLFRVGQKIGGIPPVYLEIRNEFEGDVLVGGGIKNLEDILMYYKHHFSGVLIGTIIYDGTLNLNDLNSFFEINR